MEILNNILPTIQITLSILLVALILLQQTGVGMGTGLGGNDGSLNTKRRGLEKSLLSLTIFVAVLFVSSVAASFWI